MKFDRPLRVASWLFAFQFVALDVLFRGFAPYAAPRALASAVVSVALWTLLGCARDRRPLRVVVALAAGTLLASQALFFRYYHTAIDAQVVASAIHNATDVRRVLVRMAPALATLVVLVTAVEYALLSFAFAPATTWRRRRLVAAAGLAAALVGVPLRDATPDLRALDALRMATKDDRLAAAAIRVPPLLSAREELPSVLLILTESVRAADYCSDPKIACATSPAIHRLLDRRVPLRQMRSLSSYTAVSMSALITGRTQEGAREALAAAPNVFELVRAVRTRGGAPKVAYWSAHSESVFERRDVRGALDSFVTLEDLLGKNVDDEPPDTGFDRLLTAHVIRSLPDARGPLFLMLHFFGTHAPYFVDATDAPFQPWHQVMSWSGMPGVLNAYKNAIHEQDKNVAACVRAFIASRGASPWIIAFTSDHGEAFGERGAIHHGQNLFEEQIHVPAFVAYSPGALRPEQERALAAYADEPVTHLDVLPTLLDAYGVLDGFSLAPLRASMKGRSLLRPVERMSAPLPMTNCTEMFPCPVNTWGMLDDDHAIAARLWDNDWLCTNLRTSEASSANDPACLRLREASKAYFPLLPNRRANR